jgi:hypothetical protein
MVYQWHVTPLNAQFSRRAEPEDAKRLYAGNAHQTHRHGLALRAGSPQGKEQLYRVHVALCLGSYVPEADVL